MPSPSLRSTMELARGASRSSLPIGSGSKLALEDFKDRLAQIADGESRTVLDVKGAGIITRLFVEIGPKNINRNDVILRIYWDGNREPSVASPIGPFFGQG